MFMRYIQSREHNSNFMTNREHKNIPLQTSRMSGFADAHVFEEGPWLIAASQSVLGSLEV